MNMALDPRGKYLIQKGSGQIFVWSEALSKRKDMSDYDPVRSGKVIEGLAPPKRTTVPIEIQGQTFQVEPALYAVLMEMGNVMVGLQEQNAVLLGEQKPEAPNPPPEEAEPQKPDRPKPPAPKPPAKKRPTPRPKKKAASAPAKSEAK